MVRGYYAEIVKLLIKAGCEIRRHGKGDHEVWFSPITQRTFTLDRGVISRHTANATLKQAGLGKRF
nr:type II toxin-antitoxin system HicA family toxin [uncultured Devosia sp.]